MLSERLAADLKQAMLDRDQETVSVLRMLRGELKNAEIAKTAELSETDEITIIRKEVKKRGDAAAQYRAVGNEERATLEEAESAVLQRYLPAAADEDAVRAFLKEFAPTLGTLEPRHRRNLIEAAMAKFEGTLDGQTAARLSGELFS